MELFTREITPLLQQSSASFPIVTLTGPRQSGKTTLLRNTFPDYPYINLEDPSTLNRVQSDPKGFLKNNTYIIDEAQNYPELFSYLQVEIDSNNKPGRFILSGSQNFLLFEKISQTLAGRTAILELLPLTYKEFISHPRAHKKEINIWEYLYHGAYPRPFQENLNLNLWHNAYIRTYIERDVRNITNVKDINRFQLFLKLCAGFHGQLLNQNAIAQACGISHTTVNEWLSILEASYIIFRLQPYYNNFKKRLVKTPKLYFYDSAIVCHLLGIESSNHLQLHTSRGAIFEGYILSELIKSRTNKGLRPNIYFWRTHQGVEVDGIVDYGSQHYAIEIKSGETITKDSFSHLVNWQSISESSAKNCFLIYAGNENYTSSGINVLQWKNFTEQLDHYFNH